MLFRSVPLAEQWPLVVATADLPAELGMPPLPRPAFLTVGVGDGVAYGLLDVPVSMDALMRLGEAARRSRGSALPKRPGE